MSFVYNEGICCNPCEKLRVQKKLRREPHCRGQGIEAFLVLVTLLEQLVREKFAARRVLNLSLR